LFQGLFDLLEINELQLAEGAPFCRPEEDEHHSPRSWKTGEVARPALGIGGGEVGNPFSDGRPDVDGRARCGLSKRDLVERELGDQAAERGEEKETTFQQDPLTDSVPSGAWAVRGTGEEGGGGDGQGWFLRVS
jgi:hypothetical protein